MASIEKTHMIKARRSFGLPLNPLLGFGAVWLSTRGRALLSPPAEWHACQGRAQQVWKNARLPWFFTTLGGPGPLRCNRFALRALRCEPERTRALSRGGCRVGQLAEEPVGLAERC